MRGDVDQAALGQHHLLGEHAVQRAAERARHRVGGDPTIIPALEEGTGDAVARREAGDAGADREHLAGGIGIGDAR